MPATSEPLKTALQEHRKGNLPKARELYTRVLAKDPGQPDAWQLLGLMAHQVGDHETAITFMRKALVRDAMNAATHVNLGSAYFALDRFAEAEASLRQAICLQPSLPEGHNNLGNVLRRNFRLDEAAQCFWAALRLRPEYMEAHNNLGTVLLDQEKPDEALACFTRALGVNPNYVSALINQGAALQALGRSKEAAAVYKQALSVAPNSAEVYFNLGNLLRDWRKPDEAVACYRQALALQSSPSSVYHSNLLYAMTLSTQLDPADVFAEHCRWGEIHQPAAPMPPAPLRDVNPERRLRVGYVSPDLRLHPVARFMEPILAHHNPAQVDVFVYAQVARPDSVTKRLQNLVHGWRWTCGLPDRAIAEQIRSDAIDILVDLAGHTANNRLGVFAHRPAPIQLSYLGYHATTGMRSIDYYLSDDMRDPPHEESRYVEEVVRLPHGVCCFQPPAECPAVSPPPARRTGNITFGSLHRPEKITPGVVALWSEVLHAIPSARLLIFWSKLSDQHREALNAEFRMHGISAERVELRSEVPPGGFLQVYADIDIGLDVFPWTGGTTTCEALWMGVPVIGLYGDRQASRGTSGLLWQIGLQELIAHDVREYVELAARLATDVDRIEGLRIEMRDRMSVTLCDGARFTASLEDAYRTMWRRACATRNC